MSETYQGLNLVDLIDLLEPAPEPPAVSMIPTTPGWVVLALATGAMLIWAISRAAAHRRRGAYRRAARREVIAAGQDATAIASILRRTALTAYPRDEVTALTGQDWLDFLDRTYAGTGFTAGPGQILATAPYRPGPSDPALPALAQDWIERHKAPAR